MNVNMEEAAAVGGSMVAVVAGSTVVVEGSMSQALDMACQEASQEGGPAARLSRLQ